MHSPTPGRFSGRSAALTLALLALAACSPDSPVSPARLRPAGAPLAAIGDSHCSNGTLEFICAIDIAATAGSEFSGEVGTEQLSGCANVVAGDYQIEWGDGSTPSSASSIDCTQSGDNPAAVTIFGSHTYAAAGSYTFTLRNGLGMATATATVSGGGGDTGAGADVALGISGPSSAKRGTQVSYLITVSNAGPSSAHNVIMAAPVPSGTSFVGVATSQGTCAVTKGGSITCSLGDLPSGGSAGSTVSVKVTAKVGSAVAYLASANSTTDGVAPATPDPDTSNNWASLTTTVTK
jgi:uncharacterized repeat protein (TIGR01451 family)